MAMKVNKTTITRLSIDMSCGCRMYAEFEDAQCKKPVGFPPTAEGETPPLAEKVFKACSTHEKDAALTMLQFIIGERLDEAVAEANKAPVHLHYPVRGGGFEGDGGEIEEGDTGGVVATGENVQTVARVARPLAVTRQRPEKPPGVKTIVRSPEQLAKAGAAPRHSGGGSVEMQLDEVAEDEAATPHIEELLDVLDSKEAGLFEE